MRTQTVRGRPRGSLGPAGAAGGVLAEFEPHRVRCPNTRTVQAAGTWVQSKVRVQRGLGNSPPPTEPGNMGIHCLDSGRWWGDGPGSPRPPSPDAPEGPCSPKTPGIPPSLPTPCGLAPVFLLLLPSPSPCSASGITQRLHVGPGSAWDKRTRTGPRDSRAEGAENRRKTRDKAACSGVPTSDVTRGPGARTFARLRLLRTRRCSTRSREV